MLFFPDGIFGGEVVDPDTLAREYQRASQLAARTTQYQWAANGFPDRNVLLEGDHARIRVLEVTAELYREGVKLAVAGNDPDLTRATGDPDLFQIPYNRGLAEVTDQNGDALAIEWQSAYPELVVAIIDYQYIRDALSTWAQNGAWQPRVQMQVQLDNSSMPGSGPWGKPLNGQARGTGFARRAGRSRIVAMRHAPAGPHRVVLLAGQMPATPASASDEDDSDPIEYGENPPTEGVCIGHRKLILLTFPRGGFLGG